MILKYHDFHKEHLKSFPNIVHLDVFLFGKKVLEFYFILNNEFFPQFPQIEWKNMSMKLYDFFFLFHSQFILVLVENQQGPRWFNQCQGSVKIHITIEEIFLII